MVFNKKNIKSFRETNKWTQADLAKKLGVSVATIRDWEQGRSTPDRRSQISFNALIDSLKEKGEV